MTPISKNHIIRPIKSVSKLETTVLERGPRSDRPRSALPRPYVLDIHLWPWVITLTFNHRPSMAWSHKNASLKVTLFKRYSWNKRTDRRTLPVALPTRPFSEPDSAVDPRYVCSYLISNFRTETCEKYR